MRAKRFRLTSAAAVAICLAALRAEAQGARPISLGSAFDSTIAPGGSHRYSLNLSRGGSANIVIQQMGVDIVIEVRAPDGSLFTTVDSPNGRNGDEPVEIIAPHSGEYVLLVRPYDAREPAGNYRLEVTARRDARATTELLNSRRLARDSAVAWLRQRSSAVAPTGVVPTAGILPPLDEIAGRVRVLGLGEATHGSREFGDFRLSVTKRLIARNG